MFHARAFCHFDNILHMYHCSVIWLYHNHAFLTLRFARLHTPIKNKLKIILIITLQLTRLMNITPILVPDSSAISSSSSYSDILNFLNKLLKFK
jgi:hypothetical protein